jgi:amino acid transporter
MTAVQTSPPPATGKGLKAGSLGLVSSVVIGVSSTAPGYAIAATIGGLVVLSGMHAPGIMLFAFLPMLFIAYAYRELNRVAPDCGTTFTWAAKAFGPWAGWMGGWGIIAADVVVMASLAQIAGQYGFLLVGAEGLAVSLFWTTFVGCLWIAVLTWVCYRGIEVSARFQYAMLSVEIVVLVVFSAVALIKVYAGQGLEPDLRPELSWFNPFSGSFSDFSAAVLLGVFIYWGWDSTVAVNEETRDATRTPGRAAVISTVILVFIYTITCTATIAFGGQHAFVDDEGAGVEDAFAVIGNDVMGSWFGKLLFFCILTSAAASTQTTILPTARATLSMGAYRALPAAFARIHPRFQTPTVSTWAMGGASIAFFIVMAMISDNILFDSASAVGLLIAFYYGLTGFASFWWFLRRDPGRTLREVCARLIFPLLGGVMLLFAFVKTLFDTYDAAMSYTVVDFLGLQFGGVFAISVAALLLGVVLMVLAAGRYREFFRGETLNADTEIVVLESGELLLPPDGLALPDSREQTVVTTVAGLAKRARRRGR